MISNDLYTILRRLILGETVYHLHWLGQVCDDQDTLKKGRVQVKIPELGWDDQSKAAWAWPRTSYSIYPPRVGDWVEVWFIAGDRNRPVYLPGVSEITGQLPPAYSDPTKKVLWQDPTTGDHLGYDTTNSTFDLVIGKAEIKIVDGNVTINGDSKVFVTWDELNSALQTFKTALNLHTHPTAATGPPSPPTAGMSIDISAAKTTTVKTGG
jgi:phage baseplate assembly protein gpV